MGNQHSGHITLPGSAPTSPPPPSMAGMSMEVRALHIAVMKNDVDMVRELVSLGVDVNEPWMNVDHPSVKDGTTTLTEAVSLNHHQCVRMLLGAGADVHKQDENGWTPLHKATYHGRKGLIEILVNARANVNSLDFKGNTPLSICCQNGALHNSHYTETVRNLIRLNADVNLPSNEGCIPLHHAVKWGLKDVARLLIKAGSRINYTNRWRQTPVYVCIQSIGSNEYTVCHLPMVLSVLKVMIYAGCDMVNLSLWIRNHKLLARVLQQKLDYDDDFLVWYRSNIPLNLKDLCRLFIRRRLSRRGHLMSRVKMLPVPKFLQEYLTRDPLCGNVTNGY